MARPILFGFSWVSKTKNKVSTEKYTKYLANKRLKELNIKPIYKDFTNNPYVHLEKISDEGGAGNVKTNFFESNVSSYNQSSVVSGWNDFQNYQMLVNNDRSFQGRLYFP